MQVDLPRWTEETFQGRAWALGLAAVCHILETTYCHDALLGISCSRRNGRQNANSAWLTEAARLPEGDWAASVL